MQHLHGGTDTNARVRGIMSFVIRAKNKPTRSKPAPSPTPAKRKATAKRAAGKPGSRAATKAAAKPAKRAASKPAASKPAARPRATTKASAARPGRRADFGAPTAGFFSKQPKTLRPILEQLRDLIQEAAPEAESSIKWGMPFYTIGGAMMCALAGHKSHVNLILSGTPTAYADPEGRLSGGGKTGRHLKLTAADEIPRAAVRGWLATAAQLARAES